MRNRKFIISLVSLFAFIMIIGGVSYSYFIYNKDVIDVSIETGEIAINFNNVSNNINNLSIIPKSDSIGKIQDNYIDFTVTGSVDTEAILYEIAIIPSNDNTLNGKYVKLYLTNQSDEEIAGPFLYTELYNSMKNKKNISISRII